MNRKRQEPSFLPRLLFLAAFFLGGVFFGQVLAARIPGETGVELSRYLQGYMALCGQEAAFSDRRLVAACVLYLRYPLLAFLLGFASAGVFLLPLATAVLGLSLSFAVSCFTAAFGAEGIALAVGAFGLRCAVTLPCYFWLAVPALDAACALTKLSLGRGQSAGMPRYWATNWKRFVVCIGILLGAVCIEMLCGRQLFTWLLARFCG